MYRFFVDPSRTAGIEQSKELRITGSDYNHIRNVLRMKPGEEIAVSNGEDDREFRCRVESFTDAEVICSLAFIKEGGMELPAKVTLFQGLPKADKMELIIQKTVELGVYEIVPVAMNRCIAKLDEKKEKSRIARWQGIAEAAAKQSKRGIIPKVSAVMRMKDAIAYARDFDVKLVPYELADEMAKTKQIIESVKPGQRIAIFIGPEGGFDPAEIEEALGADMTAITLGKRILRTETAGLTVLSWLMYQLEE